VPCSRSVIRCSTRDNLAAAARFPVITVIGGVDGAGKGETVNLLNEWMDPRHIHTYAFPEPSDEEREHPHMWRFWSALPPKGKLGILFDAWHTKPIIKRVICEINRRSSIWQSNRSCASSVC
jgi:AMP-polyphosphate phosphotransferase